MLKTFWKNTQGSLALVSAFVVPILIGVGGLSLDYVSYFGQKSKLQEAADVASLASVKELSLAGSSVAKRKRLQEIASVYATSTYYETQKAAANDTGELIIVTAPDLQNAEISVEISYRWAPMFAHFFDRKVTPIKVRATAKLAGDSLTCVVGLMQPQAFAKSNIHMDNRSVLKADRCSVYSNSISRYGLRADGEAKMTAQSICSAGGVLNFGRSEFLPKPITDCPKIEDPLENWAAPAYGGCNFNDYVVNSDAQLSPRVYCGGLTISGNASVTLDSGIYVIKDGPMIVTDKASLTAKESSFFLTGDNSIFEFHADTTIDLSAMETGSLAGLLFYEDRNVTHSFNFNPLFLNKMPTKVRLHKISSNNARNLLGTIYLSRSILLIDSDAPVADASAYTAIITGRLWLQEGPTLTLNADYTKTKVRFQTALWVWNPS